MYVISQTRSTFLENETKINRFLCCCKIWLKRAFLFPSISKGGERLGFLVLRGHRVRSVYCARSGGCGIRSRPPSAASLCSVVCATSTSSTRPKHPLCPPTHWSEWGPCQDVTTGSETGGIITNNTVLLICSQGTLVEICVSSRPLH